jgi:hypothetical protein
MQLLCGVEWNLTNFIAYEFDELLCIQESRPARDRKLYMREYRQKFANKENSSQNLSPASEARVLRRRLMGKARVSKRRERAKAEQQQQAERAGQQSQQQGASHGKRAKHKARAAGRGTSNPRDEQSADMECGNN